jgi:urease accessory protein
MKPQLSRLLQLASPTLPVGAYTYSQGLEWAVESGAVTDEASALQWIGDLLQYSMGRFEAPLLARMMTACAARDGEHLAQLNARYLASRESAELRAESLQMAYSLLRLLDELGVDAVLARQLPSPTFPAVWAGVAVQWEIDGDDALSAYLWSWLENQTMAALKSVPLGQAAGQRILLALGQRIAPLARQAHAMPEDAYSNFAPGFAIACSRHETQYTRLFRS